MKGMTFCLATLASFIILTSALSLKGTKAPTGAATNTREQRNERAKADELKIGSEKGIPDVAGQTLVFICRTSCLDVETGLSSTRKGNSSRCQLLLAKLSGNDKAFKEVLKHCSNPDFKRQQQKEARAQKTSQADLQTADSVRSRRTTSKSRSSSYTPSRSNRFSYPKDDSQPLKYSQQYNPRNKNSASGFVPVPGPYGFKPSTTKYPRLSQYRSDSYEDISEKGYRETSYDEEDTLGSGHFEILKGGIFPYDDNNHLGSGHRGGYSSDYRYIPKDSKTVDKVFNFRFPYDFQEMLPTEKRTVLTRPTNGRDVLSHLIAITADLDTAD